MRMTAWFKRAGRRAPPPGLPVHECQLGITGLPADAAGLARGAIATVAGQDESLILALLRGTLAANLGKARVALLSMRTDAALFDTLLATTPPLRAAIADQSLHLLSASSQCVDLVRKHGANVLLDELAVSGMDRVDLLIVSQAERLFDLDDAQQTHALIRGLRAMIARTRASLLLVFDDADAALTAGLVQALALFPNLAILAQTGEVTLLSVIRWQARASLTANIRYRLTRTADDAGLATDGSAYVAASPAPQATASEGEIPTTTEAATALPARDDRCGYRSPRDFLLIGAALMARPEYAGLHTLYRLPLRSDVSHLDALRALGTFEAGELATADQHHLHILLLGHAPDAAGPRLRQLIGQTPSIWFTGLHTWPAREEIAARLDLLHVALHTSRLPDYTAMLAYRRPDAANGPIRVTQVPDVYLVEPGAATPSDAAPALTQYPVAARTVHARPLRLRGKTRSPRVTR